MINYISRFVDRYEICKTKKRKDKKETERGGKRERGGERKERMKEK